MTFRRIIDLHESTGRLITWTVRGLSVAVASGVLFVLLSVALFRVLQMPEVYLQAQAFQINYRELGVAVEAAGDSVRDPNWDGTLNGAVIGYTYGQSIPAVGVILGPALGAAIGYTLDDRVSG